jgi:hypothetical protein
LRLGWTLAFAPFYLALLVCSTQWPNLLNTGSCGKNTFFGTLAARNGTGAQHNLQACRVHQAQLIANMLLPRAWRADEGKCASS